MCAVEPGHDEKRARERVGRKVQAPPEGGDELVQLTELESEPEDDRRDPQSEEAAPISVPQRLQSEVARATTGEKHDGVDGRDRPPAYVELGMSRRRRRRPGQVRAVQVEVH